jgi:tRNA modification GTPase
MQEILRRAPASERLREGFLVLILGPPNAGKSTLLNRLAQRYIAIVSELAGTTRDMIEVQLDLGGMPVTLVDTAGLREAEEAIEKIGVERTRIRAGEADLLLWLSEGGLEPVPVGLGDADVLRVATKSDRIDPNPSALGLSAETGLGVDALCEEIAERARKLLGDGESALVIRERHRAAIEQAQAYLAAAIAPDGPLEIVAEDIRLAARFLERIVGIIEIEQVLDVIFSRFCIGK